jgi:peptidoglycan/LPS O-acetylase OafA/YrhL
MSEQRARINSIILLRAIAALAVCFLHIHLMTGFTINPLIDYIVNNGHQGVTVFFVISGFVLPYSLYLKDYKIKDFFNFILKRSIRVDLPYWCCILLLFILIPIPLSKLNFESVFLHLTYLVPFVKSAHWYSDIFWTLSIEFQFYIMLGLLYPILNRLPISLSITIIVLLSVLCIKYTVRGIIIGNVYQFTFGYIAFLAYTNKLNHRWFWIVFLAFTIYIIFVKSIISGMVPALTVSFIILYNNNSKIYLMNFLGNISYSLYLTHIPLSIITIRLLSPLFHNAILIAIVCLCISVLFAYLFYLIIEIPALKLSKSIKLHEKS